MTIADQFSALRQRLPGSARATDEEERLLQLFRNRAELKKEYTGLQDERHALLLAHLGARQIHPGLTPLTQGQEGGEEWSWWIVRRCRGDTYMPISLL